VEKEKNIKIKKIQMKARKELHFSKDHPNLKKLQNNKLKKTKQKNQRKTKKNKKKKKKNKKKKKLKN